MNLDALKGLLIILVIMDHNDFSRKVFPQFFDGFSFHVVGFMTLPFLRTPMQLSKTYISKNFFRLYYPFFLMTCLLGAVVWLASPARTLEDIGDLALALYGADMTVLKQTTNMALLWFLPSLFSLLVVKNWIDARGKEVKLAAIVFLVLAHLAIGGINDIYRLYFPSGLLPALYVIPLAGLIAFIHCKVLCRLNGAFALVVTVMLFLLVKYFQIKLGLKQEIGVGHVADYTKLPNLLINDLEAITGTLMLFQFARFNAAGFIERCGKYSMQIYLLHAFVGYLVYKMVIGVFFAIPAVWGFLLTMLLTIAGSVLIAEIAMRNDRIRKFAFPKDRHEFAEAWCVWRTTPPFKTRD